MTDRIASQGPQGRAGALRNRKQRKPRSESDWQNDFAPQKKTGNEKTGTDYVFLLADYPNGCYAQLRITPIMLRC